MPNLQLTAAVLEFPNTFQHCLDPSLHWGVDSWRPASLFPDLPLIRILGIVFLGRPRTTTSPAASATIVGIIYVFVVLVLVLVVFLFIIKGKRVRFGDLSKVWQLCSFRRYGPFCR
jgi:hypothetical protein